MYSKLKFLYFSLYETEIEISKIQCTLEVATFDVIEQLELLKLNKKELETKIENLICLK